MTASPTAATAVATTAQALSLDGVRVVYCAAQGPQVAADRVSFDLPAGTLGCLLGPSGCGKTTVLRAIAGFEPLQAGSIRLGGAVLSGDGIHLPPERRRVGMVFQEFALFPHLDAARNIAFGLRGQPRETQQRRVAELLALVGLPDAAARYPHELSGGQQQRIALARALAPSPALLLLDEPFSSLDPATRARLAREVRSILRDAGQTALMVTHDEGEAEALADRIGRMAAGKLRSWDAPGTVL
ncbi:ABC transporter ATP-binding protein [uncultured Xylophilus sp.]|uniref:ABC transporter ATP-binding protein n=1 Tax=uncultured Xylophilus sp. TaxID=296832 RepID=UPI0025D5A375|nr:ABC transporter ATP-binding protein [uncultured Xylophilus sp.]